MLVSMVSGYGGSSLVPVVMSIGSEADDGRDTALLKGLALIQVGDQHLSLAVYLAQGRVTLVQVGKGVMSNG